MRNLRQPATGVLLLLALLAGGCGGAPPVQTEFMGNLSGADISARALQMRVHSFAVYFGELVEDAADEIYAGSDDPRVRDRAIVWKLSAIPKLQRAAFREDPLAGLVSAWSFCVQMRAYFETGAGREHFGARQPVGLAAARQAERAAAGIAREISTPAEFAAAEERVRTWAAAHPIGGAAYNRLAPSDSLAAIAVAEALGGLAAAGAMNEQMRTLNDRLNIQMELMPKQMRWQGEWLLAQVPRLVAAERDSILAAFDPRLAASFAFLRGERAALAAELLEHREALRATVAEEREAILAALRAERALVLDALRAERALVVDSLNAAVPHALGGAVAATEPMVKRVTDHLLGRLALIAAIPTLALLALAAWALRIASRRPPGA